MKKILLITSLLFISCIYAQQQQATSPLRLDRYSTVYFDENAITGKYEEAYDANGNQTLHIDY